MKIPPGAYDDEPLIPIFDAACRPYKLLTCRDVHRHKACDGRGCRDCNGTGVGEIPFGARFVCSVCWQSGKDMLRKYRDVQPPPDPPEPELEPKRETRKDRRNRLGPK